MMEMEINEQLIHLDNELTRHKVRNKLKASHREWKRKSGFERGFLIIMLIIFLIYAFTLLYPIFWAFINSFKDANVFAEDQFSFPSVWLFDNYITAFKGFEGNNIGLLIWNSVWISGLSTILGLIASSLTAYAVAKYRFKGSKVVYTVAIFIQILPLVGAVTGMYELIHGVFKIDNNPALIWPIWFGGFGFSFLMLYGAFKSVPWSFAESAFIDGASQFRTFIQIMLPAVKPVLASLFVVNFIGAWNDYMTPYLYLNKFPTLSYVVYTNGVGDISAAQNYPVFFATIIITIIPTIILFIAFQKLIMENTTTGGLKG